MDDAARLCARLIAAGVLPRKDVPMLDHRGIRADVEERLRACGLALATSAYSDHVGLRLTAEAEDATVLDAASNLHLGADACALLTILWVRLVLQRRTAEDTRAVPGQQLLLPEDRREAARAYTPSVHLETLVSEFGAQLGGRTRLHSLLGQLRNLRFISYRKFEAIEPGPLLELGIDGEKMVAFLRSRVLGELLKQRQGATATEPTTSIAPDALRVLKALSDHGEPASLSDLERLTGVPRQKLRHAIQALRDGERIEMVGERAMARYRVASQREG